MNPMQPKLEKKKQGKNPKSIICEYTIIQLAFETLPTGTTKGP